MIRKEITEDGSTTFFNEEFKQCYHSKVGAYTEALGKYVVPCEIEKLAKVQEEIKILDVCFGLGYNSGLAIEKALEINPKIKVKITGLENDFEILKEIKNLEVPKSYELVKLELSKLAEPNNFDQKLSMISYQNKNIEIKILMGDARKRIKDVKIMNNEEKYDAVFFDPFSPKECPELWQLNFIQDIVNKTKTEGIIATYSSARIVKDNFKAAGCKLSEGPKVGRRSGGVLARLR